MERNEMIKETSKEEYKFSFPFPHCSKCPKENRHGAIGEHCTLCSARPLEMGFHHVGQAGFELLISSDPPVFASQKCTPYTYKKKLIVKQPQAGPSGGIPEISIVILGEGSFMSVNAPEGFPVKHNVEVEDIDIDNHSPLTH
ncbi:hypothetical protein AAY473_029437 [Plecturocebus cupreus]